MAFAPSFASACAPRPAAAAAVEDKHPLLCEECYDAPRPAAVFCVKCESAYCVECDAAVHVRKRKGHDRVPMAERPAYCSIHSGKLIEAFCEQEGRFACALCTKAIPKGECVDHIAAVQLIPEAAASARIKLAGLTSSFIRNEKEIVEEMDELSVLQRAINVRIEKLSTSRAHARAAQASIAAANASGNIKLLQEIDKTYEEAKQVWEAMAAALDDKGLWQSTCQEFARHCTAKLPIPLPYFRTSALFGPGASAKVPNLDALSHRTLYDAEVDHPHSVSEVFDPNSASPSVLVAGSPASWQVWLDHSQPPQELPPATANALCVLLLTQSEHGGDGYLITAQLNQRVERIGSITWKRTDLKSPDSAVVVGDTALVTVNTGKEGERKVVRLDMRTGETIGTLGREILKSPVGIAVIGATGEILVVENDFFDIEAVHVFDSKGTHLRTLGQGFKLNCPLDVCVDGIGRVYVADCHTHAIVVFDGASGAHLKSIEVDCAPDSVCVTRQGQIVVGAETEVMVLE